MALYFPEIGREFDAARLEREFQNIALAITQPPTLGVLYAEPPNAPDGMIAYADGTSWNPGSGAGFYGREAGAWVKL